MRLCHPAAGVEVEGPDACGRYAAVCAECRAVLAVSDERDELFADL